MPEAKDAVVAEPEMYVVGRKSRSVPEADSVRHPWYAWYVVGLLAVVSAINYMDRSALSILSPLIKADLSVSDGQLGLLTGLAFFLFYALCGIPIAYWADRGVRRNIIAMGMTAWSVVTVLTGAAHNATQLFLTRVGVGAGEAGALPASSSIISDYVRPNRRASAFAIQTFGQLCGTTLGLSIAGVAGESLGWRMAFVIIGIPGVLVAIVVRFSLREPVRGSLDSDSHSLRSVKNRVPSLIETARYLWFRRTYRLITFFAVADGFVQFGLSQWWPSFYVRAHGLSVATAGRELGMAVGIGSAIGLLAGGLIGDKLTPRDVRLPLLVGATFTLLSLPTAAISLFIPSSDASILLVGLTWMFWCVPYGATSAAAVRVVDSRVRATASALGTFMTSVFGFGAGPSSVGALSTILGTTFGEESLRYALILPVSVIPVMALLLCFAAKALPSDISRGVMLGEISKKR